MAGCSCVYFDDVTAAAVDVAADGSTSDVTSRRQRSFVATAAAIQCCR